MQKEEHNGLTGLERGKPCKKTGGKWQKIDDKPCPNRREREKFEKLLKSEFEQVKLSFKKTWFMIFDWSKISFDWSKQIEAALNFLKTISIDWKTDSINRNRQRLTKFLRKHSFLKKTKHSLETPQSIENDEQNVWVWDKIFFKNNSFKPSFPKIKIFKDFPSVDKHQICFAQKLKVFANSVGQTKNTYSNKYNV